MFNTLDEQEVLYPSEVELLETLCCKLYEVGEHSEPMQELIIQFTRMMNAHDAYLEKHQEFLTK